MPEAKLSSKYQIVVPREVRKLLGLKPGDRLLFVVMGDRVITLRKPKSFTKAIAGLGRGLYPEDYLQKERDSWD